MQIVKGWHSADGETHEQVHDVVWSDDRVRDADGRLSARERFAVEEWIDVQETTHTTRVWWDRIRTPHIDLLRVLFETIIRRASDACWAVAMRRVSTSGCAKRT